MTSPASQTLHDFIAMITPIYQLSKPSLTAPQKSLYMQKPESLRLKTMPNLDLQMGELIKTGDIVCITDPIYPMGKSLEIRVNLN